MRARSREKVMEKRYAGLQSKVWARLSWLTVVCGMLTNRDMCLGGGKPVYRDPVDAGRDAAADTGRDAMLHLGPLDTRTSDRADSERPKV